MTYDFYPEMATFDVREEIHNILFGDYSKPGIGQPVLLRRIKNQRCACFDDPTGSPGTDCTFCEGEGYLWLETPAVMRIAKNFGSVIGSSVSIPQTNVLASAGVIDDSRAVAWCEYDVFPDYERYLIPSHPTYDKLYELKVDDEGEVIVPHIRVRKWKMKSVTPIQGQNGRIEFFECGLSTESL